MKEDNEYILMTLQPNEKLKTVVVQKAQAQADQRQTDRDAKTQYNIYQGGSVKRGEHEEIVKEKVRMYSLYGGLAPISNTDWIRD